MNRLLCITFILLIASYGFSQVEFTEIANIDIPQGAAYNGNQVSDLDDDGEIEVYICYYNQFNNNAYFYYLNENGNLIDLTSIVIVNSFDQWEIYASFNELFIITNRNNRINVFNWQTGQSINFLDVEAAKAKSYIFDDNPFIAICSIENILINPSSNITASFLKLYTYTLPDFTLIDSISIQTGTTNIYGYIDLLNHIYSLSITNTLCIHVGARLETECEDGFYSTSDCSSIFQFFNDGNNLVTGSIIRNTGVDLFYRSDTILSCGFEHSYYRPNWEYGVEEMDIYWKYFDYTNCSSADSIFIVSGGYSWFVISHEEGLIVSSFTNYPENNRTFCPYDSYTGELGFLCTYTQKSGDDDLSYNTTFKAFSNDYEAVLWSYTYPFKTSNNHEILIRNHLNQNMLLLFYFQNYSTAYRILNLETGTVLDENESSISPFQTEYISNGNYWLFDDSSGSLKIYTASTTVGIDNHQSIMAKYTPTLSNHPNPFNPTTTISFELSKAEEVTLSIYNIKGQLVRTLINNENLEMGAHSVVWNGTNSSGKAVGSGIYYYKLQAGNVEQVEKMVLMK